MRKNNVTWNLIGSTFSQTTRTRIWCDYEKGLLLVSPALTFLNCITIFIKLLVADDEAEVAVEVWTRSSMEILVRIARYNHFWRDVSSHITLISIYRKHKKYLIENHWYLWQAQRSANWATRPGQLGSSIRYKRTEPSSFDMNVI